MWNFDTPASLIKLPASFVPYRLSGSVTLKLVVWYAMGEYKTKLSSKYNKHNVLDKLVLGRLTPGLGQSAGEMENAAPILSAFPSTRQINII